MVDQQDSAQPVPGTQDDLEWMSRLAEGLAAAAAANPPLESALEFEQPLAVSEAREAPALASASVADGNVLQLRAAFAADAQRAAAALDAVYAPADEINRLLRDVEAVERARDALAIAVSPPLQPVAAVGMASRLRRTSDTVPIILGSVIGVLMILVFTTAATFVRFARWE